MFHSLKFYFGGGLMIDQLVGAEIAVLDASSQMGLADNWVHQGADDGNKIIDLSRADDWLQHTEVRFCDQTTNLLFKHRNNDPEELSYVMPTLALLDQISVIVTNGHRQ